MKKKIIVADGNSEYLRMMTDALQDEDHEVESAPDGKAALKLIKSYRPDLVALELFLPELNGFRIISELKSDPACKNTIVLALTSALVSDFEESKGFKIGHDRYFNADKVLNKPFEEDLFLDTVEELLCSGKSGGDRIEKMTSKDKVLVVDDDPATTSLLRTFLLRENYEIVSAGNGKEGLEKISSEKPDIVLLDLLMSGMDGKEVLRRAQETHPDLPIIMVTAHGSEKMAAQLMKEGAVDYIRKPFDNDEVVIKIKEALKKARLITVEKQFSKRMAETTDHLLLQMEKIEKYSYGIRHIILTFFITLIGTILGIYLSLT